MSKYISQLRITEQNVTTSIISTSVLKDEMVVNKCPVLMVGMHLTKTRGGITTLITEILKSSLKDEFDFIYIESQAEDFGKASKAWLAVQAIFRFLWNCIWKRPKLVYVHLGSNASLYRESIFIYLAKFFGKKVVAHFHAGDVEIYYPFQNIIGQKFIRRAINLSDSVIAVSEESAKKLQKITNSPNICIIPNAINTSDFNNSPSRKNNGTVKLLFVGATGKLKGEKDLIQALAILRDDGKPNIKVSFLGFGAENLKTYCEELGVTGYIDFLGAVSLAERIEFFHNADIFVLPTYAEAMPISIIEAMAAGLPVISTSVGGIPELIEDGSDGLLFSPGDVNGLARKISLLLNDKDRRIKIGNKARQKVHEQMDFNQYVEKLRTQLIKYNG